jgi:hypothetical protein
MNGIWIRSQDKKRLVFATNVYIDDYGNFTLVKADPRIIGEYPTKERALQVLDEIQAYITSGTTEVHGSGTIEVRERDTGATWRKVEKYGVVYIMPES